MIILPITPIATPALTTPQFPDPNLYRVRCGQSLEDICAEVEHLSGRKITPQNLLDWNPKLRNRVPQQCEEIYIRPHPIADPSRPEPRSGRPANTDPTRCKMPRNYTIPKEAERPEIHKAIILEKIYGTDYGSPTETAPAMPVSQPDQVLNPYDDCGCA